MWYCSHSVADPGCLSRIPDPDFYPSRIPDLGSRIQKQQQKRGVKKNLCHNFLCSHKFHKIASYFSFEVLKKKIWANFQRIMELLTQKIVNKLAKIWVWDPGSGKNLFRIPDPDPQHCVVDSPDLCGEGAGQPAHRPQLTQRGGALLQINPGDDKSISFNEKNVLIIFHKFLLH
jgi:hypothetical protein